MNLMRILLMSSMGLLIPLCSAFAQVDYYSQAQQEKSPPRKVELFTQALAQHPNAQAYLGRGWAYCDLERFAPAAKDFQQGLAFPGDKPEADLRYALSYAYYRQDNYQGCIDQASKSITLSPSFAAPYRFRALAYLVLQRNPEALADATTYGRLSPNDEYAYQLLAQAEFALQQYEGALAHANQALKLNPNNTYLLNLKLRSLDKLGRQQELQQLTAAQTKFTADDPVSLSNIGILFQQAGDYETAIKYHMQGLALYNQKAAKDDAYRKAHALEMYGLYLILGDCYFFLHQYAKALPNYTKATDISPSNFLGWNRIGQLQTTAGNYEEAILAYERSFTLKPTHPEGWVNLGFSYSQLGNRTAAIRTYNRALALPEVENKGLLYNNRGFGHLELKQYPEALADLQAAIAAEPTIPMSHLSLGEYYAQVKEYDKAMEKFNYGLSMPNLSPREEFTGHYRKGQTYQQLKNYTAALLDYQAALAADDSYADPYEKMAEVYLAQQNHCAALAALKQAIAHTAYFDTPSTVRQDAARLLAQVQSHNPNCH